MFLSASAAPNESITLSGWRTVCGRQRDTWYSPSCAAAPAHLVLAELRGGANLGQIRKRALEDQANQALCLTIVTNAVIMWNTVYMARVLEQLRAEGHQFSDDEVMHLSPRRASRTP